MNRLPILIGAAILGITQTVDAKPTVANQPENAPDNRSYEKLSACYVKFMERKGLGESSSDKMLARWDDAARKSCAAQIRIHINIVGHKTFERDWFGIWSEYWSRL